MSALATNDIKLTKEICDLINVENTTFNNDLLLSKARDCISDIENLEAEIRIIYQRYPQYKVDIDFYIWISQLIQKKEEQKLRLSSKTTKDLLSEISVATNRGLKLNIFQKELQKLLEHISRLGIDGQIDEVNKIEQSLFSSPVPLPHIDFSKQEKLIKQKKINIDQEIKVLRQVFMDKRQALFKYFYPKVIH